MALYGVFKNDTRISTFTEELVGGVVYTDIDTARKWAKQIRDDYAETAFGTVSTSDETSKDVYRYAVEGEYAETFTVMQIAIYDSTIKGVVSGAISSIKTKNHRITYSLNEFISSTSVYKQMDWLREILNSLKSIDANCDTLRSYLLEIDGNEDDCDRSKEDEDA